MRTKHAMKNISISIFSQIVIILLGFVSRKIFLDNLGAEYLGVNGLLTNILSIIILIEGGIGGSIVYNLYKPLADNDHEKVAALVQLYKKAYLVLAIIILVISCAIYPFLGIFMKGGSGIPGMAIVYFIFVAKNMALYINSHRVALINADQRGYVLARVNLIFQILTTVTKIAILVATKSYILYLIVELVVFLMQTLISAIIVEKRYPYINDKKGSIDLETKENITKNVKAMFLHNIGGYCVFGTDNILISSFVGVIAVGLYSNYTMIIGQLSSLITPIISGIGAGVGNLIATESKEKNYSIFKITYFISFWIHSFCVIFMYNLIEPFISWWIGSNYLLDKFTFMVILLNFYLMGMRLAISTFKNKAGLFVQDKYAPLLEGLINLVASIILVKYLGLVGIFIGTTISTLSIVFWNQPRIVYKHVFKVPLISYFNKYAIYGGLTLIVGAITTFVCNMTVNIDNFSFISLIVRGMICLIVPNLIYFTVFFKTEEFQYLWQNIFKNSLCKFKVI
ncbi:MAG: lipopolysaccharide biosynthesis protein [Sarcina sp.]